MPREFLLQTLDACYGWVLRITDTENNLVLGIVLPAMAAEAFVDVGIDSLQRFEDGDEWDVVGESRAGFLRAEKDAHAEETEKVKERTRDATENSNDSKDLDCVLNHAGAPDTYS